MKILRTCPICGKKFNPCCTSIKTTGVFNWREVVCSFQCGTGYLSKIENEHNPINATEFVNAVSKDVAELETTDISVMEDDIQDADIKGTVTKGKRKTK